MNERLGIFDDLQARRQTFARFIAPPDRVAVKEHRITVNVATGERTVETRDPSTPEKVNPFIRPRPVVHPSLPPEETPAPVTPPSENEQIRQAQILEGIALPPKVKVGEIMQAVAEVSGTSIAILCAPDRSPRFAYPRHVAVLLVAEIRPDLSLPQIGKLFGGRDHTTALYSKRHAAKRIAEPSTSRNWYVAARALLVERFPELKTDESGAGA